MNFLDFVVVICRYFSSTLNEDKTKKKRKNGLVREERDVRDKQTVVNLFTNKKSIKFLIIQFIKNFTKQSIHTK